MSVPSPAFDPKRLAALETYAVLDTPAEPGFDDVVHLACRLCATPVALVSLVAGDRQWFKARVGFPACQTDLSSSVCVHAMNEPDRVLVIPDLTTDPRTVANPLVTGEPFIRFYAGASLVTPEGEVLGSLCVIDKVPRPEGLTVEQADDLRRLARQVMSQLELRRAVNVRDGLRAAEQAAFAAREALRDTQAAVSAADGDIAATLDAVVSGAMRAVPQAKGAVVELVDGDHLEYRSVTGSLAPHAGLRVPLAGSLAGQCVASHQPGMMVDAATDPYVRRDMAARLELRSAIVAPILHGDRVLGVLKLQSDQMGAFAARDLEQVVLFAGAATAGLATMAAQAQVRAKDDYWRGMFDRLDEGFIVGEAMRGDAGAIHDWRYVEVNPAFGRLIGVDPASVLGRSIREAFPEIEDEWIDDFAGVVETGEPTTFTRRVGFSRRWYEGRAFKLEGDRFGVIFLEITQRVEADARRLALLSLGDRLRDLTEIGQMTRAAAEVVGLTLGATRAGFGRVDTEIEVIDVELDWTAAGTASIAGRHRFADYGNLTQELLRGEALVIDDVDTDPRTRDDPSRMRGIGVRSLVNMPVRERGRTVALFVAHDDKPRTWTPDELAFLRNVADRVEVGVSRVRAEDRQGVLNRELAHRLKNTLAIVQSLASQTLRDVTERDLVQAFDRRVLALSRAHDVLLQKSWSAARMRSVMEGVLTIQADLDRFAFDGPDLDISPQAALSLSLLLHELATNALKYGALSADGGRVAVRWRTETDGAPILVLGWSEDGGPVVSPPTSRGGFGSKLIRLGLMGTRKTDLRYDPVGLRVEFRAPLSEIQEVPA